MSNALFSKRGIMGGLIAIVIAVSVVAIIYWFMMNGTGMPDNQITLNSNAIIPGIETGDVQIGAAPYSLMDMNGQPLTQDSFPGKYKVVFFGFTSCQDECPIAMHNMAEALAKLGPDASKIQMIFISVDPKRDTLQVIKKWLGNFDARIIGATGTDAQVKQAEDSFRAYANEGSDSDTNEDAPAATNALAPAGHHQDDGGSDGDEVNHSDNIYLLSPQNGLLNVFNGDIDGASLASEIQTVLLAGSMPSDGNSAISDATPPSDTMPSETSSGATSDIPASTVTTPK